MLLLWILLALFFICALLGALVFSAGFTRKAWPLSWLMRNQSLLGEWEAEVEKNTAFARTLPRRDVWITSVDGLRLHAWWIPAEDARRTVLCAHGFHSEGFRDFSGALPYFHTHNANVLLIDERMHGQSQGKYLTFGLMERYDVQSWAYELARTLGPDQPIYLDGVSMGASTVLWALGLELPGNVKGAIADCGYTSARDILAWQLKTLLHLPAWPILPFTALFARLLAGVNLYSCHSRKALERNTRPVLVAHGRADSFVPFSMGEENARYARCERPVFAPGAGHGLSYFYARDEYLRAIEDLFAACEGPESTGRSGSDKP